MADANRDNRLTGGCLCEAVRYSAQGRIDRAYACHCSECQTRSGSAFALLLPVPAAGLQVTGELLVAPQEEANGVIAQLHMCALCYTRIHTLNPLWTGLAILRAGTLDNSAAVSPAFHIWTGSKQQWFTLPEDAVTLTTQPADAAGWRELLR